MMACQLVLSEGWLLLDAVLHSLTEADEIVIMPSFGFEFYGSPLLLCYSYYNYENK